MIKKRTKKAEFDHFSKISSEWWDPNGKFKILHKIAPIRIQYILSNIDRKKIENLQIIDLGCGGGLICEPLARLKANITGIDFVRENIEIAKAHAKESKLKINYFYSDLDKINLKKKYDIILLLEVIEHLEDWENIIPRIKKNLKPNGKIIFSTINRTFLSKIFAIFIAENFLKWVPKKTHDYNKLVKPEELKKELIKNEFKIKNVTGMNFNPIMNEWSLSSSLHNMNYFCTAELIN